MCYSFTVNLVLRHVLISMLLNYDYFSKSYDRMYLTLIVYNGILVNL